MEPMTINIVHDHDFLLQGGPYHELLHGLLGAYACYRPDVGYVSLFEFIQLESYASYKPDVGYLSYLSLYHQ